MWPLMDWREKVSFKRALQLTRGDPVSYSVSRFGEISPLWRNFLSLWQFFEGLFYIQQNCKPTLANAIGQKLIKPSGHTGFLPPSTKVSVIDSLESVN